MEQVKFTIVLGAAIRSNIINSIRNSAFIENIKISIDEDKNFFDSNYRILLEGNNASSLYHRIITSLKEFRGY